VLPSTVLPCFTSLPPGADQTTYRPVPDVPYIKMSGLFSLHPAFRDDSGGDSPPRNRVKRVLFGPTDHEENKKFVKRELEESNKVANQRWNFNFKEGTPCEGRFQWEEQKPQDDAGEPPVEQKENRLSDSEKDVLSGAEGGSSADLHTPVQGTSTSAAGGSDEAPAQPRTKDQKLVTDFLPARKTRTKSGKIKVKEAQVKKRDVSPVSSSSD